MHVYMVYVASLNKCNVQAYSVSNIAWILFNFLQYNTELKIRGGNI